MFISMEGTRRHDSIEALSYYYCQCFSLSQAFATLWYQGQPQTLMEGTS